MLLICTPRWNSDMLLGGQFRARAAARGQSMALDTSGVWGGILSGCTSGQPIFFEPCAVRCCTNVSCAGGHANFLFTQKYWYTCLEKKCPKQRSGNSTSLSNKTVLNKLPQAEVRRQQFPWNKLPQAEVCKQHFFFKTTAPKQRSGNSTSLSNKTVWNRFGKSTSLGKKLPQGKVWKQHCSANKLFQTEVWKQHFSWKNCPKQRFGNNIFSSKPLPQAQVWKQHFPFKQNCSKQIFGKNTSLGKNCPKHRFGNSTFFSKTLPQAEVWKLHFFCKNTAPSRALETAFPFQTKLF